MQETHFLFSFFFFLGDPFSILGSGRSSGEGHGNPLQYSCLKNSMDREVLAGYSPWGLKELDLTECLTPSLSSLHKETEEIYQNLKIWLPLGAADGEWGRKKQDERTSFQFFFFNNFIHLFACFWLCWVFLAPWVFPRFSERGLLSSCGTQASHRRGFSCGGAWALDHRLGHCGM